MDTGDIILYTASRTPSRWWLLDAVIDLFTLSEWVHVGMILKDPEWLGLKGTFILESAWTGLPDATDHKEKFGVQVVPFDERVVCGSTYYRKFKGFPICEKKLQDAYEQVKDKPYDVDPLDWVRAFLGLKTHPQDTDKFWCSALIACVMSKSGLIEPDTNWSLIKPSFFAEAFSPLYGPLKKYKSVDK